LTPGNNYGATMGFILCHHKLSRIGVAFFCFRFLCRHKENEVAGGQPPPVPGAVPDLKVFKTVKTGTVP